MLTSIPKKLIFVLLILILYACDNETEKKSPIDTDLSLVNDILRIEEESFRVFYIMEHIEQYSKVPSSTFPPCATILFDTVASSIKKITIDFGDGCKCDAIDGKFRKGKLEITWEGNYFQENGIRSLKSSNYYVGNGSKYFLLDLDFNVSTNSYLQFTSTENITMYKTSVDKITRTNQKTYKWRKGKNTYNELYDDYIETFGNGNGKNVDNKTYTISTSENEAIVLDMSCKWLKDGIFYLNPEDKNQRKVNYTDCDSYVNVDIQGRIYTINFLSLD